MGRRAGLNANSEIGCEVDNALGGVIPTIQLPQQGGNDNCMEELWEVKNSNITRNEGHCCHAFLSIFQQLHSNTKRDHITLHTYEVSKIPSETSKPLMACTRNDGLASNWDWLRPFQSYLFTLTILPRFW